MRGTDIYLAMQELDDNLVEKYADVQPKQSNVFKRLIAAILAVVLLAGGVVTVDAITYAQAKNFFTDNGLSTEGLSREDVRAVYRDIKTESFTYEKTEEVIRRSISQAVPGYEIVLEMDDPEKLQMLWASWRNGELARLIIDGEVRDFGVGGYQQGIWYYADKIDDYNVKTGYSQTGNRALFKYENDILCWESAVPIDPRTIAPVGDATIVLGKNIFMIESGKAEVEINHNRIACLDKDGQILWNNLIVESEWIGLSGGAGQGHGGIGQGWGTWIFDNKDETFTIINYDHKPDPDYGNATPYVIVWRYDLDGQLLSYKENIAENKIPKVFQIGNRYILTFAIDATQTKTVVMDPDGNLLTGTEYQITDQIQTIQDIVESDNYRYISAYTMLTTEGEDEFGRPNFALDEDIKALWKREDKVSEKELIEHIRGHYTAILLRCDIETGELQTFYSVPGAIADKLEVTESGELIWRLQSLTQAEMITVPSGTGCIIRGTSVIYQYVFDEDGKLKGKENTGELASYRWQ